MKKIITALGNPETNKKLKEKGINIIQNDIQYQEGILELLEKNNKVDYIILDEKIPGNFNISELIFNIKKINNRVKIILISNDKDLNINVFKIINRVNINEIITILKDDNIFNKQYMPINDFFNEKTKEGEIITILGPNGIGKSIFSVIFASYIKEEKIAIIDFDVLNNSLHTLLGVKNYSKKIQNNIKNQKSLDDYINIKDFIIKTKYNIDLISGINLLYNSRKQLSSTRIRNIIKNIRNQYSLIIIDTSSECLFEYTKDLVKISNNSFFISGANLLEIKKTKKLLDIYRKEWNIPKDKLNIIFNKYNKNSIDENVLRKIFYKYNILGKISLSDYYDLVINKNNTKVRKIKREISNINRKYRLSKNKKLKIKKIKR